MCLCLAIGAVAFNGESVNLVEAREDFSCDEKGYVEYLSKWSVAEKSTSRDVRSEEFKKRLGYFVESCEKIHEWNKMKKYRMEFTFYADWHPDEFEELTTTKQRYSGVKAPVPSITPVYNNTNYRYLMPSMDPCDENAELRELISKPQNCSVSWAFAITNSIEYAIKKMYFEEYDQIVEVSLSAQELIDCVGENGDDFDGVYDEKKGMGSYNAAIDDDALEFLADISNGDARNALNAIELGILTTDRSDDGVIHIDLATAQECIQKRSVRYDKEGDNHYDTISAFIKSMRGSDPDAVSYYLAKMLYAGEDIKFIARRIMICASEDVGNADPNALQVAVAAAQAVERIGMPEARIILSQAALYVATAPKSNACYMAIDKALDVVKNSKTAPVPVHLQDAHYKGSAKLGHGVGYLYAHDYPNHYVRQQYLPDAYVNEKFYEPEDMGYERDIKKHLDKIKSEA